MPRGVRGYRWIETGHRVWQLEHPSGSRRFIGVVSCTCEDDVFTWWTTEGFHGESKSHREAMREVEQQTIPSRQLILAGRKRALAALKNARIGAEEGERLAEQEIQRSIEQG